MGMAVRIKRGALIVVIFCLGTAFAMAYSQQENDSPDVVEAATKSRSTGIKAPAGQDAESPAHFNLSAIKRTVPARTKSNGLFQSRSWFMSPSLQSAARLSKPEAQSPQQPAVPTLPFIFVGRMIDGDDVSIFLSKNDHQYVARVNDVLDDAYRVDKITDSSAVLTYLPMNSQLTLTFNSTAVGSSALREPVQAPAAQSSIAPQTQQQPSELLATK